MSRIRGQEINLSMSGPNGVEEGIANVLSMEIEFENESIVEQYLGHESALYDEIYVGIRGSCEVHPEDTEILKLIQRITDKARRRDGTANYVFNAVATMSFVNGQRPRIEFPDIHWAPISLNVGGRAEYVPISLEWHCSLFRFISL